MKIHILTTCYNAVEYIHMPIHTLKNQTIDDWKCWITNDMSTDGSEEKIKELIKDDNRFELIDNKSKFYQCGNYWQVLQQPEINNEDICLTLDGDDWLPDGKVFERVLDYYKNNNIWITYGQFAYYDGFGKPLRQGFARTPDCGLDNMRTWHAFTTTHLRTWKAWLFRKIRKEDLQYEGNWIPMAGDTHFMTCMLEMAGTENSKFINDINYVYNVETGGNEFKVDYKKSAFFAQLSRDRKKYLKIK